MFRILIMYVEQEHMSDQQRVTDILNRIDATPDTAIDERMIKEEVLAALEVKPAVDPIVVAELIAFTLFEGNNPERSGWPTYYGAEYGIVEGVKYAAVELNMITADVVGHWLQRAQACNHPILKARYSGLAWDFKRVVGADVPFAIALLNVRALIDAVNRCLVTQQRYGFIKLTRALTQSLAFKQDDLTQEAVAAIMNYERTLKDEQRGRFGFSYDLLVKNWKGLITDEQRDTIISELEGRLERITAKKEGKSPDPWKAQEAADRLAEYYAKAGRVEDVQRVIRKVGQEYEELIGQAAGIQAYGWLETLYKLYLTYGLKDEAVAALARFQEIGKGIGEEMAMFGGEIEIPKERIDSYVENVLMGTYDEVLTRVAVVFIPTKAKAIEQIAELSKEAPLSFLFSKQIIDEKGRPVVKIKSAEEDESGHIALRIADSMKIHGFFLNIALTEGKKRGLLTPEAVMAFVSQSAVIKQDRMGIIQRAIDAYFSGDYLSCIHLLVPQIEEACRTIIIEGGGNPWGTPNENGGFHNKVLDTILRDEVFSDVFTEDAALYFRVLLTDQRGWNVRNSVCHGLWAPEMFTEQVADRLIHALLCLGLVRQTDGQEDQTEPIAKV